MGQVHILTREQEIILDQVAQNDFLRSSFYFTGGTALSSIYLHHRYSEDLDFFTPEQFDQQTILSIMQDWGGKHGFTFQAEFIEVVHKFLLTFPNGEMLKVDFARYPYRRIEEGKIIDMLNVDSLSDIATNKLFTVTQRDNAKDFVDLYFLLETFTLWDLREGVRQKFKMELEPMVLASDLLKVEDFISLPKMIKPLTLGELKAFFRQKAKELGRKSVE